MSEQFVDQAETVVDNDTSALDAEPSEILDEDRLDADPLEDGMDGAEGYSRDVRLGGTRGRGGAVADHRLPDAPGGSREAGARRRSTATPGARRPQRRSTSWTSTIDDPEHARGRRRRRRGRSTRRPGDGAARGSSVLTDGRRTWRSSWARPPPAAPWRPTGLPADDSDRRGGGRWRTSRPTAGAEQQAHARGAGELSARGVARPEGARRACCAAGAVGIALLLVLVGALDRRLAALHRRARRADVRAGRRPAAFTLFDGQCARGELAARRGRSATAATPQCGTPHDVEVVGLPGADRRGTPGWPTRARPRSPVLRRAYCALFADSELLVPTSGGVDRADLRMTAVIPIEAAFDAPRTVGGVGLGHPSGQLCHLARRRRATDRSLLR